MSDESISCNNKITCTPISPVFGARLSGIDTARPATAVEAQQVQAALWKHKLVIIPGNRLSVSQLATFGKSLQLGEPEIFGAQKLVSKVLSGFAHEPEVLQLEYGPDQPPADINLWHQDHTWRKTVTRYELSYMDVRPELGGDVLYADATKAYQRLSPKLQQLLQGTTCQTVLAQGYQNLEFGSPAYAQTLLDHPPIPQPVVACGDPNNNNNNNNDDDDDTPQPWLNVNKAYSTRILELSKTESDTILALLFAHITQPENCVRLHYQVGDVVIFDNHRLQHYAVSDYYPAPRRLLRMSFDAQPLHMYDSMAGERAGATTSTIGTTSTTKPPMVSQSEEKKEEQDEGIQTSTSAAAARVDSKIRAPRTILGQQVADLATELTAGIRLLHQGKQSDLCAGFFSARVLLDNDDDDDDESGYYLAPSHGIHWNEMTPKDFGVYQYGSTGSTRVAGQGRLPNFPTTAVPAAIYQACPEINAIVHAHPRSVMALCALLGQPDDNNNNVVLPISEPSFMFYERVAVLKCNFFFDPDYIAQMVHAIQTQGAFCLIMKNHSYTMVGRSIQECYIRCYMLEQSCAIQLQAMAAAAAAVGGRMHNDDDDDPSSLLSIPDREECLYHRRSYEGYDGCPPYDGGLEWPGLVRGLDRDHPEWAGDRGAALAQSFERATTMIGETSQS
jgi:taurine dioxygenase